MVEHGVLVTWIFYLYVHRYFSKQSFLENWGGSQNDAV